MMTSFRCIQNRLERQGTGDHRAFDAVQINKKTPAAKLPQGPSRPVVLAPATLEQVHWWQDIPGGSERQGARRAGTLARNWHQEGEHPEFGTN